VLTRVIYAAGVLPSSELPGCLTNGGDRRDVFRVDFDAEGYSPDDITVRVAGSRLTVHGIRRETDEPDGRNDAGGGLRRTTTEFCRRIRLPDDVDRAGLTCVMIGSRLVVEAPRTLPCQRNGDGLTLPRRPDDLTSSRGCASDRTMNTPTIRVNVDETGVREMSLDVDIGRVFRPDDVTVKVKNSTLTLTVVAERVECSPVPMAADGESAGKCPTAGGALRRLNAHQTWEFDLPGAAEMDTLKAGLTVDGMLKITATMKPQQDRQQTIAG
jgi:HSP20 family molecular chaperone IbpA